MDTIILSVLLIVSWVVVFIQYRKIWEMKNYINNIPKPENIPNINISMDPFAEQPKGKRGLLKESWNTKNSNDKYTTFAEVEEVEVLGDFSRIKLIKVTGAPPHILKLAEEQLPEIILSKKIDFFP